MKKSLVITLALVFVLGIAGTAFAANPFSDVPANHWAYAAVSKLAEAGIVSGYGDGRFNGNRTITRYEMAQIVAKAMANGNLSSSQKSQVEKLAAEYADELDSLGVKVAKLEKNADNVKITGEARISHYTFDKSGSGDKTPIRTRLWVNGQINDKWKYQAMLQNDGNDLERNANQSEGKTDFKRAAVFGKIGAVDVTAGRFYHKIYEGVLMDSSDSEGLVLGYKAGDFKITAFATRPDFQNPFWKTALTGNKSIYGGTVDYKMGSLGMMVGYYNIDPSDYSGSQDIFEVALDYKFTKEAKVWAEYFHGDEDIAGGKDGWAAGINWSNLNKAKPGTFGFRANYFDVPASVIIDTAAELDFGANAKNRKGSQATGFDGYKGYQIGATYMAAKNIDINVDYYDFEGQKKANGDNTLLWSYVRFYF